MTSEIINTKEESHEGNNTQTLLSVLCANSWQWDSELSKGFSSITFHENYTGEVRYIHSLPRHITVLVEMRTQFNSCYSCYVAVRVAYSLLPLSRGNPKTPMPASGKPPVQIYMITLSHSPSKLPFKKPPYQVPTWATLPRSTMRSSPTRLSYQRLTRCS